MNLAIRGITADFGPEHADTSAPTTSSPNPPFNDSDRFRKGDDVRWQFGVPLGLTSNN